MPPGAAEGVGRGAALGGYPRHDADKVLSVEPPSLHLVVGERAKQEQLIKELRKAARDRAYIAVIDGRAVGASKT